MLPSESERLLYAVTALVPLMDRLQSVGTVDGSVDLAAVNREVGVVRTLHQALRSDGAAGTRTRRAVEMLYSADLRAMQVLGDAWPTVVAAGAGERASVGSDPVGQAITSRGGPDPETDRPVGTILRADERYPQHQNLALEAGGTGAVGPSALSALRRKLPALPAHSLDVLLCLRLMCMLSSKWSYRDLKQFFSALNYVIMCSERYVIFGLCVRCCLVVANVYSTFSHCFGRCELTTQVWLRELLYAFD